MLLCDNIKCAVVTAIFTCGWQLDAVMFLELIHVINITAKTNRNANHHSQSVSPLASTQYLLPEKEECKGAFVLQTNSDQSAHQMWIDQDLTSNCITLS